jgi:hypothetical protein
MIKLNKAPHKRIGLERKTKKNKTKKKQFKKTLITCYYKAQAHGSGSGGPSHSFTFVLKQKIGERSFQSKYGCQQVLNMRPSYSNPCAH